MAVPCPLNLIFCKMTSTAQYHQAENADDIIWPITLSCLAAVVLKTIFLLKIRQLFVQLAGNHWRNWTKYSPYQSCQSQNNSSKVSFQSAFHFLQLARLARRASFLRHSTLFQIYPTVKWHSIFIINWLKARFVPSLNWWTVVIAKFNNISLTSFKFDVDVLKKVVLVVKCNSSSNVNQYKSLLLHYFYGNSLIQCLSIYTRDIIKCNSVKL